MAWFKLDGAPRDGREIIIRTVTGQIVRGRWACDDSGGEQPAFAGWFYYAGGFFAEITAPLEWQPIVL
jgi:hypothetical protein